MDVGFCFCGIHIGLQLLNLCFTLEAWGGGGEMHVFFCLSQSVVSIFLLTTGHDFLLSHRTLESYFFTEHILNISKGVCHLSV